MSDNGYGGGYDPYAYLPYPNAPSFGGVVGGGYIDPNAGYSYSDASSGGLGYSGGSATGGLYDTPVASYGGGAADSSNPYYLGDSGAGPDYGGGTRDFWDRAGDWLAKPGVQRGFAELGGLGQGLLQGSGPSLQPRNFYSALGQGMAGAETAGAAYDTSQLKQAQTYGLGVKAAGDLGWNAITQNEAANATGRPPGYGAGYGASGSGASGAPAATPTSAGYGGGTPTSGGGGFASVEPHIMSYENRGGDPYLGTGSTPLSATGLSATGFPQQRADGTPWNGIPVRLPNGKLDYSTAAGLYQITQSTWDPIAAELGIKDFSPESQRRVAEELYNRRGLQPWLVGNPALRNAAARGLVPGQAGSAAMAGGDVAAPLRDTSFQMPSNMAAGLGGPGGILPQAPPAPPITQPPAGGGLVAGLRPPVAPAPLIATAPAAAGAPPSASVAVFEGAGNVASIDRNLENNPNYYRDKLVVLTPVGASAKLDKLPDQIASVKEAGGQPVLQAGNNPKQNARMAAIAAKEGVPYREPNAGGLAPGFVRSPTGQLTRNGRPPDTYIGGQLPGGGAVSAWRSGADTGGGGGPSGAEIAPVPVNPEPSAAGNVPGAVPAAIAPPAVVPAATVLPQPAAAGPLATGGALQLPPGAPATPADAGPALVRGTALGVPQPPPPAPPPVMPGAVVGAPIAPPPAPVITAPGAPVIPSPPAVAASPRPPPMPNLNSIPVPPPQGMPPYDIEAARRAQVLGLAAAATGHTLPAYLTEQAGLPGKALEQQWKNQNTAYDANLKAAQAQWQAASDLQKQEIAAGQNMQRDQYGSELARAADDWKQGRRFNPQTGRVEEVPGAAATAAALAAPTEQAKKDAEALAEFDRPRTYDGRDANNNPYTFVSTPRQMGATPPPGLGGARGPGGTFAPPAGGPPVTPAGTRGGFQSGLGPTSTEEYTGTGKRLAGYAQTVHDDANTAVNVRSDLEFLSALGPNISAPGPLAEAMQSFNRVRQSLFGNQVTPVASYELAQQIMGSMMRTALRQSDPNPTERQQAMLLATMPTPASSREGFQEGIRQMQGVNDYKVFKRDALNAWMIDPAHNRSAEGFEANFRVSAIPFVLDRMSGEQQTRYMNTLAAKDPQALQRLRDQVEAVRSLNYTYRY